METIFDHNVTKHEIEVLLYLDFTKEQFIRLQREVLKNDEEAIERQNNELLYDLYYLRGDKKTAMKFADRIPNDVKKYFETLNHDYV